MNKHEISFCFPAYNEEANIKQTILEAAKVGQGLFSDYEIVVTDDGSKDKTAQIVAGLIKTNPKIKLIRQENKGYGGSVWTALTYASKELVFFTDADLQFKLADIETFIPYIEENDVVIGFRAPRADPMFRIISAWTWNRLAHFSLGINFRDADCAFKLFKKSALDGITIRSKGNTFSPELLWRLSQKKLKIKELPVKHYPRAAGSPKGLNMKVVKTALRELRSITHESRRKIKNT